MEINVFSILLVLIPLVLNLILGFFIYIKLPADKRTNLFLLFLLSLIFWQLEEFLIRLKISPESKYIIDGYLSVGWIFLGAFLLHFTIHLVNSRLRKERLFYLINYGVTLGFYLLYINHPEPVAFNYHAFFGDIPVVRPGTFDFYKRLWIVVQVYYALFLMGVNIHRNKGKSKDENRVSQVKWVFVGVSIPALVGFFTHFFLPLLGIEDLAITASSMTAITVCTFIGMTRSNLFNFLEFISVDEIMRDIKSVLLMFDKDLNVFMKNDYTNTLLSIEQEHEINLGDFLSEKSKNNLRNAMLEKGQISKTNFLELNAPKQNKIALEYSLHQTGQFGDTQLYLLLGNDVSETFSSRQKLKAFNRYFKYFLEASNESFFELDPFTGEIHWNETEFKIFGKEKLDVLYSIYGLEYFFQNIGQLEEFLRFKDWIFGKEKIPFTQFVNFKKCDGEQLYLSLNSIKVFNGDPDKFHVIGTVKDTTLEYEHFKEIAEKDLILREIAWIQSHRVRAPLANILGLVCLLKSDDDITPEEREELLNALKDSAEKLDQVIKEVVSKANLLQ